jgi:putative oxidoreductase
MQFLEKLKPLGLLVLRLALGASFMFHGYPKLSDPAHWVKAFPAYGFPGYFAYIAGILELFGGGLLIVGLFTRGIGLLLAIEMGVALTRAGFPEITMHAFGQYEIPLLLGAASLALTTTGAGIISIDAFTFESSRKPPKKNKG